MTTNPDQIDPHTATMILATADERELWRSVCTHTGVKAADAAVREYRKRLPSTPWGRVPE